MTPPRHARACRGHPRFSLSFSKQDVDGRDKPGHDSGQTVRHATQVNAAIDSEIASIDFSVASAPIAIDSLARWKSNRLMRPSRGLIMTSGGSPARRGHALGSCITLDASNMTVDKAGPAGALKK